MTKKTVTAKSKKHLKALIRETIKKEGYKCDLNFIDVSQVTDMSWLFDFNSDNELGKFNGDISKWNVSNVSDMQGMFVYSEFNKDISGWDVSSVTDMGGMFSYSCFNGDITLPAWDGSVRKKSRDSPCIAFANRLFKGRLFYRFSESCRQNFQFFAVFGNGSTRDFHP